MEINNKSRWKTDEKLKAVTFAKYIGATEELDIKDYEISLECNFSNRSVYQEIRTK